MKIKTFKTTTEEVEVILPEFFESEGYYYMVRSNIITRVYVSSITNYSSISTVDEMRLNGSEVIKPISREKFFEQYCKVIELSTGFKFNPESDGELNNFAQAHDMEADVDQFMIQQYAHEREQFSC